jgi:hypothetical protein
MHSIMAARPEPGDNVRTDAVVVIDQIGRVGTALL